RRSCTAQMREVLDHSLVQSRSDMLGEVLIGDSFEFHDRDSLNIGQANFDQLAIIEPSEPMLESMIEAAQEEGTADEPPAIEDSSEEERGRLSQEGAVDVHESRGWRISEAGPIRTGHHDAPRLARAIDRSERRGRAPRPPRVPPR